MSIEVTSTKYKVDADMSPWALVTFALCFGLYCYALRRPRELARCNKPAGLARRTLAFLLDSFIVLAIGGTPATLIGLLLDSNTSGVFAWHVHRTERLATDSYLHALVGVVLLLAWLLFALPVYRNRQSVGLIAANVVIETSRPLTFTKACLRTALGFFTLGAAWLSIPLALKRSDKCLWHDLAFGTKAMQRDD